MTTEGLMAICTVQWLAIGWLIYKTNVINSRYQVLSKDTGKIVECLKEMKTTIKNTSDSVGMLAGRRW